MKLLIEVIMPEETDLRHKLNSTVQLEITFQTTCKKISAVLWLLQNKTTKQKHLTRKFFV